MVGTGQEVHSYGTVARVRAKPEAIETLRSRL
jgi:hypothetical protein